MINDRPHFFGEFTFLLIRISNARYLVADDGQWFGVNVGFDDEDQNLMENLYILKGYIAKNFRNFRIKVGDCGD